jgi:hypothetical protein
MGRVGKRGGEGSLWWLGRGRAVGWGEAPPFAAVGTPIPLPAPPGPLHCSARVQRPGRRGELRCRRPPPSARLRATAAALPGTQPPPGPGCLARGAAAPRRAAPQQRSSQGLLRRDHRPQRARCCLRMQFHAPPPPAPPRRSTVSSSATIAVPNPARPAITAAANAHADSPASGGSHGDGVRT